MRITFDTSEINAMISANELQDYLVEDAEDLITDIFIDLTAPPPLGTPVDTGARA